MLAVYGVVNRSSKSFNALQNVKGPSLIFHHVWQACYREGAPAVPAQSGTFTDQFEGLGSTAPVNGLQTGQNTPEISTGPAHSHSSFLDHHLSHTPGPKAKDKVQPSKIVAADDFFALFGPGKERKQKRKKVSTNRISLPQPTANDPEEPLQTAFLSEQRVRTDDIRTTSERDQNAPNNSQGVEHTAPDVANKPIWADSLFERLRNPKSGNTELGLEFAEKFSLANPKAKKNWARKPPRLPLDDIVRTFSNKELEQRLTHTANRCPSVYQVQVMLRELIEVRHVQPQTRHYEALILANCEARYGSADALYLILAEMEREKIAIGKSTLSAALKVLSIHPDARLLPMILHNLLSQWATPSTADIILVILTLVRLNQYELALPYLENLIDTSPPPNNLLQTPIPQFLYTSILYRLASPAISDHNAVLHLLYLLTDNNLPISNVCISYLLDCAAEALHLELTLHLWRSHVDLDYITPSTGLCRNALLTAARNRNGELAQKAAWVLEMRGNKDGRVGLELEELEMVREAFVEAKDVNFGLGAVNRLEKRMVELRREGMELEAKRASIRMHPESEEKVRLEPKMNKEVKQEWSPMNRDYDGPALLEKLASKGGTVIQPSNFPSKKRRQWIHEV